MPNTTQLITFRAPARVRDTLTRIMDERGIDRTSTIKLALYLLDAYMSRPETQQKSLAAILQEIEASSPRQVPFGDYSWTPEAAERYRSW